QASQGSHTVWGTGKALLAKVDRQMVSLAFRFSRVKTPKERAHVDLETHYTKEYLDEKFESCTRRAIPYRVEYVKNISSSGMQSSCGFVRNGFTLYLLDI
uniref:Uncharacterized protein n=1 Tax=Aegilops tauschii subsp. strangulata TaxID=200361 RepID=A0A453M4M9_AEGTS